MNGCGLQEDLCGAAPNHNQAAGARGLFEIANVFPNLLGKFHLVLAFFHIAPVEPFHVISVENRFARLDRRHEGLDLLQQFAFEHARFGSCGIHVVFKNVPASENQIFKPRQREEILNSWRAVIGALSQANRAHLRERPDGLGQTFTNRLYTGHKRGGDGAHAGNHDAQLAGCRLDGRVFRFSGFCLWARVRGLLPRRHIRDYILMNCRRWKTIGYVLVLRWDLQGGRSSG